MAALAKERRIARLSGRHQSHSLPGRCWSFSRAAGSPDARIPRACAVTYAAQYNPSIGGQILPRSRWSASTFYCPPICTNTAELTCRCFFGCQRDVNIFRLMIAKPAPTASTCFEPPAPRCRVQAGRDSSLVPAAKDAIETRHLSSRAERRGNAVTTKYSSSRVKRGRDRNSSNRHYAQHVLVIAQLTQLSAHNSRNCHHERSEGSVLLWTRRKQTPRFVMTITSSHWLDGMTTPARGDSTGAPNQSQKTRRTRYFPACLR
jgi:hypothetical protein